MFSIPPPMPPPVLPKRTDSLTAPLPNSQLFVTIDDELRDSKRVQRQGQEEDLREALSRMMTRVEELCALLKSTYQTNSDLETSLTLAQSNLKLAIANNEMLEDALRRNSSSKDVGWRRSSRETAPTPTPTYTPSPSQRVSLDEAELGAHDLDSPDTDGGHANGGGSAVSPSQDSGRFFRFRFASGRSTPTQPHSPPGATKSLLNGVRSPVVPGPAGHLTSASLPSLLPASNSKELEDLRAELEAERLKFEKMVGEKRTLESELESLSQALFEEANKMVSTERIKRAEAEEELRETYLEKEALRSALKLIESENGRLRSHSARSSESKLSDITMGGKTELSRLTHSRSSSNIALKSPTSSGDDQDAISPSPATSPTAPEIPIVTSPDGPPPALDTPEPLSAPGSPAPLYVPPPHSLDSRPTSRTGSPLPLPHPHLPSHLRSLLFTQDSDNPDDSDASSRGATPPPPLHTARQHPSAPPPSAADSSYSDSPWARRPSTADSEERPFSPPPPDELDSPWA